MTFQDVGEVMREHNLRYNNMGVLLIYPAMETIKERPINIYPISIQAYIYTLNLEKGIGILKLH